MRLFVGVELPWELRERLLNLAGGLPGARWVPHENLHLTLRFVGELTPDTIEEVDAALSAIRAPGFDLSLSGIGTHNRAGREVALWVGVERNPALDHVQAKIETAIQRAGLPVERRRFTPHITLARLGSFVETRLAAYVQTNNLFRAGPVKMREFVLFSSLLGPDASVYTAEARYGLG